MRFCASCGSPLEIKTPSGEDRLRHCCVGCGDIHYVNPRIIAACIVEEAGDVLLCQRAIEPRSGFWTLPGGYMESGETSAAAAAREVHEETGVRVVIEGFYALCEDPDVAQVYVVYRGRTSERHIRPGLENIRVSWLAEDQVPWKLLTYPLVGEVLKQYFRDRAKPKRFPVRFAQPPGRDGSTFGPREDADRSSRLHAREPQLVHFGETLDGYL